MDPMTRLYSQLDRIEETLDSISPRLAAIETDLAYHIKRSDLAEERIDLMEAEFHKWKGFFSIGGWLLGLMSTAVTILSKFGVL